jgi:hypothetical protein
MVVPVKPGEWPEPLSVIEGQGDLPNPGDHSLESTNAFNKREDVPITEQKWIDNPNLGGPDQDGPDGFTHEDRIPRRVGEVENKSPKYYIEEAPENDRLQTKITPRY